MPSITRALIEAEIVRRHGKRMVRCGLDVSSAGANGDLNQPMRDALAAVGYPTTDPLLVADSDVAPLAGALLRRFFEVAELRVIERMIQEWGECQLAICRDLAIPAEERAKILADMYKALITRSRELLEEIRRPLRSPPSPVVGQLAGGRPGSDPSAANLQPSGTQIGYPYFP